MQTKKRLKMQMIDGFLFKVAQISANNKDFLANIIKYIEKLQVRNINISILDIMQYFLEQNKLSIPNAALDIEDYFDKFIQRKAPGKCKKKL